MLPTHSAVTNAVIARNRRIGVGIVDFTGWKKSSGTHRVTKYLRKGYDVVRETNAKVNDEAGVPHAIRCTTIKPGGSIPKLPGRTSGAGYPTFIHTLRRIRIAKNSPICQKLIDANIPYEDDCVDKYTYVFEFPILQGPAVPAEQVTIWEQALNIVLLQREWADNAVSNTLYFKPMWELIELNYDRPNKIIQEYFGHAAEYQICYYKMDEYVVPENYKATISWDGLKITEVKIYRYQPDHEENDIESVLSAIAPITKTVSVLPHSTKGVYRQMPEEGLTEGEYEARLKAIKPINWHGLQGSEGLDERYCTGPVCELPQIN